MAIDDCKQNYLPVITAAEYYRDSESDEQQLIFTHLKKKKKLKKIKSISFNLIAK